MTAGIVVAGRVAIPANQQGMVAVDSDFWRDAHALLLRMREGRARMTRSTPVGTGLLNVYELGDDMLLVNLDPRDRQPVVPHDVDADAWFLDIAAKCMSAPTIAHYDRWEALRPVRAFVASRGHGLDAEEEVVVHEEFPGRGAVLTGFQGDEAVVHESWEEDEILPTTVRLGVREMAVSRLERQRVVPVVQIMGRNTRLTRRSDATIETLRMHAAWEERKR